MALSPSFLAEDPTTATGNKAAFYDDINFEEIDDDLAAFQEDDMVQQALHRGVDLKKYGNELERELRKVSLCLFVVCLSILLGCGHRYS